jgi:hypothetical protein
LRGRKEEERKVGNTEYLTENIDVFAMDTGATFEY